jgi:glycosyltransferase involved in cell wall biosynthesis
VNLLFFGIVRRYRGLDVLLRALPAVLKERPVRLVVAGEFWDPAERYRELARELRIEEHVDIRPGYVPEPELLELLRSADVMVAPYRSATQRGAVEMAFVAGLPVVASRVDGLADQVEHGDTGLLVPPDDPDALSQALLDATEPETLARLTKGARADHTVHTWEALVDDIRGFSVSLRTGQSPTGR